MNLPARIEILTNLIDQLVAVNKLQDQIAKAELGRSAEAACAHQTAAGHRRRVVSASPTVKLGLEVRRRT